MLSIRLFVSLFVCRQAIFFQIVSNLELSLLSIDDL